MTAFKRFVFNFPGGIISPGYLFELMRAASGVKVPGVRLGNRQQLFLEVSMKYAGIFMKECRKKDIRFETGEDILPNIVSSYVTKGIFIADTWLSEGVYKDILDMFDYAPSVKVNICDGDQGFVPFFNGNINWIASSNQNFWNLYIRFPKTNRLFCCPDLIYTNDIVYMTKAIEAALISQFNSSYQSGIVDANVLYQKAKASVRPISKPLEQEWKLPDFRLPYYEGFNRLGNHYWLGIYRRNELFPVSFLHDLSRICMETKLGEIYSTPWKSLIIKGIEFDHRKIWDQLLGKYRINVRHAANELNWHLEDYNDDGLILKRHIIRYFDKEDVRTYGLCFTVKIRSQSGIFGSVIIRRQKRQSANRLKSLDRYEIFHTVDFNPNSSALILFRNNVKKEHLGPYLVSLCKLYYENLEAGELVQTISARPATIHHEPVHQLIYQCRNCLSVYDEKTGDPQNGIQPGTEFDALPDGYSCPLCESPKNEFAAVVVNRDLARMPGIVN